MPKSQPTGLFRCREAFFAYDKNGAKRHVATGSLVKPDDPVLKGREALFEPAENYLERVADERASIARPVHTPEVDESEAAAVAAALAALGLGAPEA